MSRFNRNIPHNASAGLVCALRTNCQVPVSLPCKYIFFFVGDRCASTCSPWGLGTTSTPLGLASLPRTIANGDLGGGGGEVWLALECGMVGQNMKPYPHNPPPLPRSVSVQPARPLLLLYPPSPPNAPTCDGIHHRDTPSPNNRHLAHNSSRGPTCAKGTLDPSTCVASSFTFARGPHAR